MSRLQFYQVKREAFLFSLQSQPDGERSNPEEAVRQWCAYELIRAYGISIRDIEFERPVRVGSKTYRIDILVMQNGHPSIVVECKETGFKKHDEGMAQAISYADAQGIGAEFAVYTNGQVWNIKRRINNKWVSVPDLPERPVEQWGRPITQLLLTVHEVAPLLYKLDEHLDGEDAQKFLSAMQSFFSGYNLLTEEADKNLIFATDNVLRVLAVGKDDPPYNFGKMESARASYENFRKQAGFPYEICPIDGRRSLHFEIHQLYNSVQGMTQGTRDIIAQDALLLRSNAAILEYAELWSRSKGAFLPIGSNLHGALRAYLSHTLALNLNFSLPDTIDTILVNDLRSYCHAAWNEMKAD